MTFQLLRTSLAESVHHLKAKLIDVRYKTALKANYAFRQIYIITFFSTGERLGLSMAGMQTILVDKKEIRSSSLV